MGPACPTDQARVLSKDRKVVKSSKWISREGISTDLRDSLKSLHRKEIKGQTGALRRPGVLAGTKFHKAPSLLPFTKKKMWKMKDSKQTLGVTGTETHTKVAEKL